MLFNQVVQDEAVSTDELVTTTRVISIFFYFTSCLAGKEERASFFAPIVDQLLKHLPITDDTEYTNRVYVPVLGL